MADINKLIMFGKKQRTVTLTIGDDKFEFLLETPQADRLSSPIIENDPFGVLVAYIIKLNDYEYTTPSQKSELRELLRTLQNGVVRVLSEVCTEMALKQSEDTEEITKK